MSELFINKSIDYITFSTDRNLEDTYLHHPKCKYEKHRKAHYKATITICDGAKFFASDDPVQGNLIEISGDGMRNLRHQGLDDVEHLAYVKRDCRNITRLDYAIDLVGGETSPNDLKTAIQSDLIPNLGRKKSDGREGYRNDEGQTVYVGARTSELFLRCYNAGVKNSIEGVTWTRLELEMKQRRARQALELCNTYGVITPLDRLMIQACDAREAIGWYNECLRDVDLSFPIELPRKATSFEKHLETVLKTILGHASNEEDTELIVRFRAAINEIELYNPDELKPTDDPMYYTLKSGKVKMREEYYNHVLAIFNLIGKIK